MNIIIHEICGKVWGQSNLYYFIGYELMYSLLINNFLNYLLFFFVFVWNPSISLKKQYSKKYISLDIFIFQIRLHLLSFLISFTEENLQIVFLIYFYLIFTSSKTEGTSHARLLIQILNIEKKKKLHKK